MFSCHRATFCQCQCANSNREIRQKNIENGCLDGVGHESAKINWEGAFETFIWQLSLSVVENEMKARIVAMLTLAVS